MRLCRSIARMTLLGLSLLMAGETVAVASQVPVRSLASLPLQGGSLEVSIHPDGERMLPLRAVSEHRWVFDGSTAELVGTSYTIVLRNRTAERLKVVLGVDGLNVYRKIPLVGRAEGDVGSILGPWSRREIPGWQLDLDQAQRFVFAPSDWSEGAGIRPREIGTLRVEVYSELVARDRWWRRDVDEGESSRSLEEPRSERTEKSQAGRLADNSPAIGTSSGKDLPHRVRTVSFEAASDRPEAKAMIDYGHSRAHYDRPSRDQLGLELIETRGGSRVVAVSRGSKAALAGLQRGDLILRVDTVHHPEPATVRRVWHGKRHGEYLFLRLRRGEN